MDLSATLLLLSWRAAEVIMEKLYGIKEFFSELKFVHGAVMRWPPERGYLLNMLYLIIEVPSICGAW